MALVKRMAQIFLTAYILMFFSEFFFMNEGPVFDVLSILETAPLSFLPYSILFTLWYFGPAAVFLAAITYFRVRTLWALVLAGALYGWAVEGIVAWQMYEALPFSISWTPLGWHVIVDVLVGWYAVRWVLSRDSHRLTAVFALALGLFWGAWGTWFWGETDAILPTSFALFAFFVTVPLVLANLGLGKIGGADFRLTKIEVGLLMLWAVVLFAINILPLLPTAVFVLPPPVLITLFALRRNKAVETRPDILYTLENNVRWGNHALLLLTPAAAAITYPIYYAFAIQLPVVDFLAPLLLFGGFVIWLVSFVKTVRDNKAYKLEQVF